MRAGGAGSEKARIRRSVCFGEKCFDAEAADMYNEGSNQSFQNEEEDYEKGDHDFGQGVSDQPD